VVDWAGHASRQADRYRDGEERLPETGDADARQRQLTRMGNAAAGAALALLMAGSTSEANDWFARAIERYRESYDLAPRGSWGRLIAILKADILSGDWAGAEADASWTIEQDVARVESPIGRYAATLALLVLGRDAEARVLADELRTHDGFPSDVGDALATIAAQDVVDYIEAIESVLTSFETRDEYLEDLRVADTVLVLQALARRRDMAAELESELLPAS
jgi:hypothetical protein